MSLRHVVLGDGVAGMSAAQAIRQRRPGDSIVIVSDDPAPFYFRAALTNYLKGQLSEPELWALPQGAWSDLRLERRLGRAEALDVAAARVRLADGSSVAYDRLLVATGARARTIGDDGSIAGADARGVLVLRRLSDVNALVGMLPSVRRVVIVGGGILGVEAADGLRARNVRVTLVHRGPRLLDRLLDARGADLVEQRVRRDGIDVVTSAGVAGLHVAGGRVRGVTLTDGRHLPCDVVLQAIGNVPNTAFLAGSGIEMERGYVVAGTAMSLAAPGVFAAGDVAVVRSALPFRNPSGLWQPARRQGHVAGTNMSREGALDTSADYEPGAVYSATMAWDLPCGTLGDGTSEPEGAAVVRHESRRDGRPVYKKAVLSDGHVVSVLMLGDRREAQPLRHLMNLRDDAGDASAIADRLFDPSFDLAAWVGAQERRPGVRRLDVTVPVAFGPLPPSRVARDANGRARDMAGSLPAGPAATTDGPSLALESDGHAHAVRGRQARLGSDPSCDVVIADDAIGRAEIVLRREGAAWMASSSGGRAARAELNGRPLLRAQSLQDGDLLRLGRRVFVVRLAGVHPEAEAAIAGWLVGEGRHAVRAPALQIGSASDNHVVLERAGISPFHAQVLPIDGDCFVVDCGSESGTFVNGEQLAMPRMLRAGDVVSLGDAVRLRFEAAGAESAREPEPVREPEAPATDAQPPIAARLVGWEGRMSGRSVLVRDGSIVGRGSEAGVRLDDPLLSRAHARIERRSGAWHVADMGSLNGVAVNGRRLEPGEPARLHEGDAIRLGGSVFRLEPAGGAIESSQAQAPPDSAPTRAASGLARLELEGRSESSWPLDRDEIVVGSASDADVVLRLPGIARRHVTVRRTGLAHVAEPVGGASAIVSGEPIDATRPRLLHDGDVLALAPGIGLRFRENIVADAPPPEARGFRIDWTDAGDPLQSDFTRIVRAELDACIGCHECMRACPLPDAQDVTIAALNAAVSGLPLTGKAARFVADCTQCQACVPVCPVDIHRSHLVLWNKLKTQPDSSRRVPMQAGDRAVESTWSVGELSAHLATHPIFGRIESGEARERLLAHCRFRALQRGEQLVREGEFATDAWLVLDGTLAVGMARAQGSVEAMVTLGEGQVVGLDALLSDQSSAFAVSAHDGATVMGIPRHALQRAMAESPALAVAVRSHAMTNAAEVLLARMPLLRGVPDVALAELMSSLQAEAHVAGRIVCDAAEARDVLFVVRRGYVAEVRVAAGRERIANYLGAGQAFGMASATADGDAPVRFEAATRVEVLSISRERLREIAARHEALATALRRLVPATPQGREKPAWMSPDARDVVQGTGVMLIDTRACVDCNNCVDACERRHGTSRLVRTGRQLGHWQVPAACFHCEDPVCLFCAVDGIVRLPTGEIRIVEDNCIGCGQCADRCPYDNIVMAPRTRRPAEGAARWLPGSLARWLGLQREAPPLADHERVAVKCDLCAGHDDGPACVRSCPVDAAMRVARPSELFQIDPVAD